MQTRPARLGFTLIEVMVVVVIISVLASVAVPAFIRYSNRARVLEGVAFIQEIRARQEAYRVDNGTYCRPTTANPAGSVPRGGIYAAWVTSDTGWNQLGAAPDSLRSRFQYTIQTGLPGSSAPSGVTLDTTDFWFVARGDADLDGDGVTFFLEGYSGAGHVYNSVGDYE